MMDKAEGLRNVLMKLSLNSSGRTQQGHINLNQKSQATAGIRTELIRRRARLITTGHFIELGR
jgi:hypothetical protein